MKSDCIEHAAVHLCYSRCRITKELRDFLNDVRQASYSIRNHIERNFGAKEQEYITDEFAIGDPVKIPETKDEKPSEKASGKEKKAKSQPER